MSSKSSVIRFFLALLGGFSFVGLIAQPAEELKQYQERYPGAPAVILNETVTFQFEIERDTLRLSETVEQEMFYLSEVAGYWKDSEIGYTSFSSILNIEAKTLVPVKNKYKTYAVSTFKIADDRSAGIFHDDSKSIVFSFDRLQQGGKSRLSYTRLSHDPHLPGRAFLQSFIPIEKKTVKIIADPRIELGIGTFNLESASIEYTEQTVKNKRVLQ